jgi:hypothetical protein
MSEAVRKYRLDIKNEREITLWLIIRRLQSFLDKSA